jgi:hypothetical protein
LERVATGETTLALHPASDKNPAGKVELGFTVPDVEVFYPDMSAKGVLFSVPPTKQDFDGVLAQFVDSGGAHCSVGVRRHRNAISWTPTRIWEDEAMKAACASTQPCYEKQGAARDALF